MKKKTLSILIVIVLLTSFIAAAQADFGQTYYKLRFTTGYPVYTGPGLNYYRANGNAFYGGGVVRYYGTEPGGWLMIGYQTSGNTWRMGYVEPGAASNIKTDPADYTLFGISFTSTTAYLTQDSYVTDDPLFGNKTPLTNLATAQPVTVLGRYNDYWTYVEVQKGGMAPIRGYVQSTMLSDYVPQQTPTYAPTPLPTYAPTAPPTYAPTAPPTAAPSGTPYLSSLTHNAPNTGIMVPGSFTPSQKSYLLTVADWVSRIYFVPYSPNSYTIYFNGMVVGNGAQTPTITLTDKPTSAIFQLVGAGGASSTYTVYIQRRPSERETRVSAGYIDSMYSSGGKNYIRVDRVDVKYTVGTNLSTFINGYSTIFKNVLSDNCIYYYGTMNNPIRAISFSDFLSHYTMYGSTLYRFVINEDEVVAVMPYNSDYATP